MYGAGSLLFLLLPVFSSPDFAWDFEFVSVKPFQRSFISYCLLLIFFFVHLFWLLPRFYFLKRYWLYGLLMMLIFLLCSLLPGVLVPRIMPHHPFSGGELSFYKRGMSHPHPHSRFYFMLFQHLFQFMGVGVFSFTVYLYAQWKRAERAIVDAELAYLKAQINPHFLFNTLNSIYSLAIQKSDATAEAVVQLSNLMRYVLTDASQDFVPLRKEIDYLTDYIALQSTRLTDNVVFEFQIIGEALNQQIAPMLLVPLIENAFKYGANPDEECYISIFIEIKDKHFVFAVKNKKIDLRTDHYESNKLGIENVRKRLLAVYPSNSDLTIRDDPNIFMVILKISFE